MLDNCYDQSSIQLEGDTSYNPIDIQAVAIFDLTVLSQVSNTSKAVIGVSVVFSGGGRPGMQSVKMSFSLWNKMMCHGLFGWLGGGGKIPPTLVKESRNSLKLLLRLLQS